MSSNPDRSRRQVQAWEFEADCLKLVDQVEETGEEIIITKRNQPVAKLMPIRREGSRPFVGRSRGVISASREELMAPIDESWEVGADL